MKLTVILIMAMCLSANANVYSQEVSLSVHNESLQKVFKMIRAQTGYNFLNTTELLNHQRPVSFSVENASLEKTLKVCLEDLPLTYVIIDKTIVIKKKAPLPQNIPDTATALPKEDKIVRGKVSDENGTPLEGVSILIKGSTIGTHTDPQGNFSIAVPDNSSKILVFSYVGAQTKEVAISSESTIIVTLKFILEEEKGVVVVGYGTQKKITATGAIASIEGKQFVQSPVANLSNSLVGRVPGLFALQSSGEPGFDQSRILIRGIGTFNGSTDPLILMDGIEISNFNNIDPNEVANVTLLKDASATAVFGIRGANGVIIVTTKRGQIGPPKISFTVNQGFNSFTDIRKSMTSPEFAQNYNQAMIADRYASNNFKALRYSPQDMELYENGSDPIFHPNIQWADFMFRKHAPQSQYNINVSGGQSKVRYFISGGFFNQQGMFKDFKDILNDFSPQSTYKRINLRSNFNFEITNDLKMTLDLSTQTETRKGNNSNNSIVNNSPLSTTSRLMGYIMRASALDGPGAVDGKIVNLSTPLSFNPLLQYLFPANTGGLRRNFKGYMNGSLRMDYDLRILIPGLSTHATAALQSYNDQYITHTKRITVYMAYRLADGSIIYKPANNIETAFTYEQAGNYNRRVTGEFGFDYKKNFNGHNITALALYNQQKTYSNSLLFYIPKGYQSYVGRLAYDYRSRYMLEANVGYNGTENFAEGKRFGLFPAYSAGWVLTNEPFFPKTDILNLFKVSVSYGEVGNDNIGGARFLYRPTSFTSANNTYYFGTYPGTWTGYPGVRENPPGNPNVTWERAVKKNLRFETGLLSGKINLTADIWSEERDDILARPGTYSLISGFIQPPTNLGKMQNRGYEGIITYTDDIGKLHYSISANHSFARNKILFMDEVSNIYSYMNNTGYRLGQSRVLLTDGLFNNWNEVNDASRPYYSFASNRIQPGDLKYRDINGDGYIDGFDVVPMGYSNIPEKTFGASLAINFKGFDFSVLFQGAANVSYRYSPYQMQAGFSIEPFQGSVDYLNESWTPDRYAQGLPINFPRFAMATNPNLQIADIFLADASYVRLKNLEIGYAFQPSLLKRLKATSLRIYMNANNLLTWSKMLPGIDPEVIQIGDGMNEEPYPQIRTVNFGINLNL